jgi:predicted glycoside hydrolase/deacetylase ChbG (UPF0249 family)
MMLLRFVFALLIVATPSRSQPTPPAVLLRVDDAGLNASVNRAVERIADTGMPVSVSVLFVAPQWREAVEILRKHPHVAVGVHLALNSEWRGYRWGPVAGASAVPSLVDSAGEFHPSREAFLASRFDLGEVEREIDAQIQRARSTGLKITYVDAHMGMLEATPELRATLDRVAARNGLAVARRFGESYFTLWNVPVASKASALLARLERLKPDSVNLVVIHAAERSTEMDALFDLNAPAQNEPGTSVAAHRAAELDAVLSAQLAELARDRKIRLVTYANLAARYPGAGGPPATWWLGPRASAHAQSAQSTGHSRRHH